MNDLPSQDGQRVSPFAIVVPPQATRVPAKPVGFDRDALIRVREIEECTSHACLNGKLQLWAGQLCGMDRAQQPRLENTLRHGSRPVARSQQAPQSGCAGPPRRTDAFKTSPKLADAREPPAQCVIESFL